MDEKKIIKKLFIISVILAIALVVSITDKFSVTGMASYEEIPYTHSHTKAVCDQNNYCEDIEIFCKNNTLVEIRLTKFSTQFSESWQDPRNKKTINEFC